MADDPIPSLQQQQPPLFPDDDYDLEDDVVYSSHSSDDEDNDNEDEPLNNIVPGPTSSDENYHNDLVLPPSLSPPPPPPIPSTVTTTITTTTSAATTAITPRPIDDSRRLFQRLWTDEDEIELLQGFLDYTASRGGANASGHHHDTTAFYDQIKNKLQLEFNKNQLVEKLRRLKKKYRNVISKMSSGKEFVFKSPHDQATFELSRKIWFNLSATFRGGGAASGGGNSLAVVEFDDDDKITNPNHNHNASYNNPIVTIAAATPPPRPANSSYVVSHINLNSASSGYDMSLGNSSGLPKLSTRKRPRIDKTVKIEGGIIANNNNANANASNNYVSNVSVSSQLQGMVEETVRNCLSPVLKDLIKTATNGTTTTIASASPSPGFKGVATLGLNAMPLNFSGVNLGGSNVDEKWRKQQIMELEVYSKRLELVQDQIKVSLEELKSMES